jgi:allophanate hydrolase subunit 1
MVLSGLNRRDLRTPRKRRSRDATEKALPSVGIGEAVAGMREELSTGLASIGGRLDVHEALPSENAHGKRH